MRHWPAIALIVACGGDPDDAPHPLEGLYTIVSYRVDVAECNGTDVDGYLSNPFFQLEVVRTAGADALALYDCDTPTTCQTATQDATWFDVFDHNSATGQAMVTSYASGLCYLKWFDSVLFASNGKVTVTTYEYETRDVPGTDLDDCRSQHHAWTELRDCVGQDEAIGTLSD